MEEIWKDIEGYTGIYQVSNLGRVRSLDRDVVGKNGVTQHYKAGFKTQRQDKDGYLRVSLSKRGKSKGFGVHRLVAQAFIPNPDNLPQVNHRDENPSNNKADNLEWCTQSYNNAYGNRMNRVRDKIAVAVIATNIKTGKVREFESMYDCSMFISGNHSTGRIYEVLNGKRSQFKGYTFKRPRKVILYQIAEMIKQQL